MSSLFGAMNTHFRPALILLAASFLGIGCASQDSGYYASDQSIPPYTAPDGQVPPPDPNAQQPSPNEVAAQPSSSTPSYTQRPVTSEPRPWDASTRPTTSSTTAKYPVAVPVKGKKGQVTSPYAQYAGPVSVEGLPPGSQAKCPYTGKIFIVP
ncbi:MAG: hypothetical protein HC904_00845 [Blastochloris sp.]|nr:hypothetical protein [Blastochloris sp.]